MFQQSTFSIFIRAEFPTGYCIRVLNVAVSLRLYLKRSVLPLLLKTQAQSQAAKMPRGEYLAQEAMMKAAHYVGFNSNSVRIA